MPLLWLYVVACLGTAARLCNRQQLRSDAKQASDDSTEGEQIIPIITAGVCQRLIDRGRVLQADAGFCGLSSF